MGYCLMINYFSLKCTNQLLHNALARTCSMGYAQSAFNSFLFRLAYIPCSMKGSRPVFYLLLYSFLTPYIRWE